MDEAVEFFQGTFAIDAELGLTGKVCHETHRNRAFYSPYLTAQVLKRVPKYDQYPQKQQFKDSLRL